MVCAGAVLHPRQRRCCQACGCFFCAFSDVPRALHQQAFHRHSNPSQRGASDQQNGNAANSSARQPGGAFVSVLANVVHGRNLTGGVRDLGLAEGSGVGARREVWSIRTKGDRMCGGTGTHTSSPSQWASTCHLSNTRSLIGVVS
eukprot:359170-Chlamydomonas_euryale.AAC.2